MSSSSKKRKVTIPEDSGPATQPTPDEPFVEGSVIRVKLENFVTYDAVEFKPGPHLNVIIGPNATGKSTIVCAICLGLAGKADLLGRARHNNEFIKHGCNRAVIEIELFNTTGDNYIINRVINRTTSVWTVNGRPASQKSVEELVARLNIQVGNLCQFLPQDKVADFAKMSQQELLESTEKAVGPPEMFERHCRLKAAREDSRKLEGDFQRKEEELATEKQRNSRLKEDVKNYQERQHHIKKIKTLKMKRPWVEYEEMRKRYQAEKERKDEMQKSLKDAQKQHAPLRNALDSAKTNAQKAEGAMRGKNDEIKDHAKGAVSKNKQIEEQGDKMTEVLDELKGKRTQENQRRKKVTDLKKHLDSLQNELTNLDESEDVQPRLDVISQEMRQVNKDMTKVQQEGDSIKAEVSALKREITGTQHEIKTVQDVGKQRLEMLRRKFRDTFNALEWYKANEHRFTGKIYEPLMLLINVKDPRNAKYIENHINSNDLRAFVAENQEDLNLFLDEVRGKQKLKVNGLTAPTQPVSSFKPRKPITAYRKYGFHSYLKDLFDCPEPIMRYLCLQYRVHCIPVGDQYTKDNVATVVQEAQDLNTFYTLDHQYNIKKSKYNASQTSSRCTELRPGQLLTVSMDHEREERLNRDLQEKQQRQTQKEQMFKDLTQQYKAGEKKMNDLRSEKKTLTEKRDIKKSLQQKINTKQQSIQRYESEAVDITAEEAKAQQKIHQLNLKKIKYLTELKDHTQKCLECSKSKVRLSLVHAAALRKVAQVEAEVRERSATLQTLERQFQELKEHVNEVKDTARQLLTVAKKATNTQANEELSVELKKAFELCPSSLDEIDAAIHEEQARVDCTFQTDEGVVQEYEDREKRISHLENEVTQRKNALERHQQEIEDIKALWFGPLKDLIYRINENFSFFFRSMKCAGEVDLNIPHDNPEDYEKYGVRIKVKFRDTEPLRELTAHHQSGGERSVSTVLYMMALQELTSCPFRCVDEINQGMDPVNERKVFELMVSTVCRRSTSQYFLLTPKLLPNLEYADNMTVLCVYNGPYMMSHNDWSLRKFLRRRSKFED